MSGCRATALATRLPIVPSPTMPTCFILASVCVGPVIVNHFEAGQTHDRHRRDLARPKLRMLENSDRITQRCRQARDGSRGPNVNSSSFETDRAVHAEHHYLRKGMAGPTQICHVLTKFCAIGYALIEH